VTDISAHSIKPSGPSEPSANLDRNIDGGHEVSKSTIFRLGRSDIFGCHTANREETGRIWKHIIVVGKNEG
jgi:hypothetical protein